LNFRRQESPPEGATLKEAVDFFKKRNPASLEKRTVFDWSMKIARQTWFIQIVS
jgi:hypothetical protein